MFRLFLTLLPAALFAGGNLIPVTVIPREAAVEPMGTATAVPWRSGADGSRPLIGKVDTVGGTTYDWQTSGPISRSLVNSPGYGIHATWMRSASTSSSFPDRNMRYNYYDFLTGTWNWIDPSFMLSGINAFAQRAGFGNLDADLAEGLGTISCHYTASGGVAPMIARDLASGAGIFEYASGEQVLGYTQWPPTAVSGNGAIHIFPMTVAYVLSYSHIAAGNWPTFASPITGFQPSPEFPTHNLASSKRSGKVCLAWGISSSVPQEAYVRTSPDYGVTWTSPMLLPRPNAFGGDTATSFHITSLFPFYDGNDRLNLVANLAPVVNGTLYVMPSQIWHYCPNNTPPWNRVHVAGCAPGNLRGSVGYNATYACRPSIGEDSDHGLFVVWEQFDSANVESITSRLRADVWVAGSTDGGLTWSPGLKLTDAGTASCRFPCICDQSWSADSLAVIYEVDECAGFFVQAEGPVTYNPIIVQKFPIDSIIQRGPYRGRVIRPNRGEVVAGGDTFTIAWTVNPKDFYSGVLSLSTDGGSTFPTVLRTSIPPAETTWCWDSIPGLSSSRCRVKFAAADSLGAIVFSAQSEANFTIDSDTPPAPVMLFPKPDSAVNASPVSFRWRRAPDTGGIAYYRLQVAYDSLFQAMADTARPTDTFCTRVLAQDTFYYWRLRAHDRAGHQGPWTRPARFELDTHTPGTPTLLEPPAGAWLHSPNVVLRWSAVQFGSGPRQAVPGAFSPVRYVLAVDTTATNIDLWVDTLSATTETLTVPWQRRYWWQVRAFDLAGNRGAVSPPSRFGFDTTPPPMVTLFRPPDSGFILTDTVRLIWRSVRDNASGLFTYHLQLAPDTLFTETLSVSDTVYLETLPGPQAYYWRVRATDSAGNVGAWSPRRVFTYGAGVAENRLDRGPARVAGPVPNPFALTTVVRLTLPCPRRVEAHVFDAAGQKVRTLGSGPACAGTLCLVWDGTDRAGRRVPAGVYYLRTTAGDGNTVTQAVVLSR